MGSGCPSNGVGRVRCDAHGPLCSQRVRASFAVRSRPIPTVRLHGRAGDLMHTGDGMERHEHVGRTAATGRRCRRVAVMVAVSLIGALLALPVVAASTAPSAAAASEVPPCPPGTNPNNANCIPADAVPAGGSRPADPSPGAARPWDANRVALPITVTGPSLGGLCPDGGVPYSAMPCTHRDEYMASPSRERHRPGTDPRAMVLSP